MMSPNPSSHMAANDDDKIDKKMHPMQIASDINLEKQEQSFISRWFPIVIAFASLIGVVHLVFTRSPVIHDNIDATDTTDARSSNNKSNTTLSTFLVSDHQDISHVKFAWLMSFPNSGTSYTLRLTSTLSNRLTATNYGDEHLGEDGTTILYGRGRYVNGPFPKDRFLQNPPPGAYTLTKTHCGGRCTECAPERYRLVSLGDYLDECLRSSKIEQAGSPKTIVHYDPDLIDRVVHLMRNPFDNIVSRYHLHWNRQKNVHQHEDWVESHPKNVTGFTRWCAEQDTLYPHKERHTMFGGNVSALAKQVPCHAEFFKYTQWHNLAFKLSKRDWENERYLLHYEDYDEMGVNETAAGLFTFLRLDRVRGIAAPEYHRSYYDDHFSSEQRKLAVELVKHFASEDTWTELSRSYKEFREG